MARGMCLSRMMSSLVRTTSPSAATPGGGAGSVPTAITIFSAEISRHPSSQRTISVCGSVKDASPRTIATSFRRS